MQPSSYFALVVLTSIALVSSRHVLRVSDLEVGTDLQDSFCSDDMDAGNGYLPGDCSAEPANCNVLPVPIPFAVRLFFNVTAGTCQSYPKNSICPPHSKNYFLTFDECSLLCVQQCQQRAPGTGGSCAPLSQRHHYNGSECVRTQWDGCKTTENIFESQQECLTACSGDEGAVSDAPAPSSTVRPVSTIVCPVIIFPTPAEGGNTQSGTGAPNHATIRIVSTVATLTVSASPAPNNTSTHQLSPDHTIPTGSTTSTTRGMPVRPPGCPGPGVNHPALPTQCQRLGCIRHNRTSLSHLNWGSVYARDDCMEMVIRLYCREGLSQQPSDTEELNRLCALVKSGVERYWSRNVTHDCNGKSVSTYVSMRVQLVDQHLALNAKDVVIKVYSNESQVGNIHAHTSDMSALTLNYYDSTNSSLDDDKAMDDIFEETAAHELGYSVLGAVGGFFRSWTNKGTTTWDGKLLNKERQPATGEIDLMTYYAGPRQSDWRDRTIAAEIDVLHLVSLGKFAYCTDGECGGKVGHPLGHVCIENSDCTSGRCILLRCVQCTNASYCSTVNVEGLLVQPSAEPELTNCVLKLNSGQSSKAIPSAIVILMLQSVYFALAFLLISPQ
eukprot:scpid81811/ scgid7252/ 